MTPQEFAFDIAKRLQAAGFDGLWAGGCVRDQLLGRIPKDYDVATNANPSEVRELFGRQRTIAIGEAFGVITVIGSKESGNIEIATFRRDANYSDGRRPDAVEFTDAKEDALRRDFTINGMFFDPVAEQLIDFVDGRADIDCRIVRAIGDPHERINEDKLRMLRAVRFAATFGFQLEAATKVAVTAHAAEITVVSEERIGAEMRRMLAHPGRVQAAELMKQCGLLDQVLEEGSLLYKNLAHWRTRLRWLGELGSEGSFVQAAAILLSVLIKRQGIGPTAARWKLSNAEGKSIVWIEQHLLTLSRAHQLPWSEIQPLLIQPDAPAAVEIAAIQFGGRHPGVVVCHERLAWEPSRLNPKPLIGGDDLAAANIRPGPIFSKVLRSVRNAQLDGEVLTQADAMRFAHEIIAAATTQSPAD